MRDSDRDGLARMDMGAIERFEPNYEPYEVRNLVFQDADTVTWDTNSQTSQYHVYRGNLADLGFDFYGVCRDDLDTDLTDTELVDGEVPGPGAGFTYAITIEHFAFVRHLGVGTCAERSNYAPCP